MVWSVADLSANELAWAALDKPLFSNNALYNTSNAAGWDAGTTSGTVASSTEDATGFEAERLFDGFPGLTSKPNASGTNFTIVFDRSTAPITFDWFGILNHNLETLNCSFFSLQIADNSTFTQNLVTLSSTVLASAIGSDRRWSDLTLKSTILTDGQDETNYDGSPANDGTFSGGSGYNVSDTITLDDGTVITVDAESAGVVTEFSVDASSSKGALLGNAIDQSSTDGGGTGFSIQPGANNLTTPSAAARRYSNVPFVRIQIACSSGTPYLGQIVLGRRRQMQFAPQNPWDPTGQVSSTRQTETGGGIISRTSKFLGRRVISGATFIHDTSAMQTEILDWWDDIEAGLQPFFIVDNPDANPFDFWMMFYGSQEPSLGYPFTSHQTRQFTMDAVEQGPNHASLENW